MGAHQNDDLSTSLMLDGNAIAGDLQMIFGSDMTANDAECSSCGRTHAIGALLAFTGGPGFILRCPSCTAVMLRIARTPQGTFVDARGSVVMHLRTP